MADAHKNFALSTVATAPSPATTGTSLVVNAGQGALFPAPPFNATVWPSSGAATSTNAEIVRVTAVSTDTLTITRQAETGGINRTILVGDQIAATVTLKTLTDIENLPVGGELSGTLPNPIIAGAVRAGLILNWGSDTPGANLYRVSAGYIRTDGHLGTASRLVIEPSGSTNRWCFDDSATTLRLFREDSPTGANGAVYMTMTNAGLVNMAATGVTLTLGGSLTMGANSNLLSASGSLLVQSGSGTLALRASTTSGIYIGDATANPVNIGGGGGLTYIQGAPGLSIAPPVANPASLYLNPTSASQRANLFFYSGGAQKWLLYKETDDSLRLFNNASVTPGESLCFHTNGIIYLATVTVGVGVSYGAGASISYNLGVNGTIGATSTITASGGFINSDKSIKSDISSLNQKQLHDSVLALRPVVYNHKRLPGNPRLTGLIAQEVAEILPTAVEAHPDPHPDAVEGDTLLGIDYAQVTVALIGAVQHLVTRVQALEHQLKAGS